MRAIKFMSAVVFAAAAMAPASSIAGTAASPVIQVAAKQTPSAACDAARKSCYAGRTVTTSSGARAVPPEVVRECEGAYRQCVSGR